VALMDVFGYSLDNISLLAITLAVGLVVVVGRYLTRPLMRIIARTGIRLNTRPGHTSPDLAPQPPAARRASPSLRPAPPRTEDLRLRERRTPTGTSAG